MYGVLSRVSPWCLYEKGKGNMPIKTLQTIFLSDSEKTKRLQK